MGLSVYGLLLFFLACRLGGLFSRSQLPNKNTTGYLGWDFYHEHEMTTFPTYLLVQ